MLFNSWEFGIFFLIVVTLYFILPYRARWFLLLVSSCYFYMSAYPAYILILFFLILVDYGAGIWIDPLEGSQRRLVLILSLIANGSILFVFKYFNFINANLSALASTFHFNYPVQNLSIILPIGLSFHTFQSVSYTIEVYKKRQKPERNLGIYALYVLFFPQLVAGPIERPQNLLHQFREKHDFDYQRISRGLQLVFIGLFKKVAIADQLAEMVNTVYENPSNFSGPQLLLATYFFAFQIYCDFSGYTDMARGTAEVLGFRLMENFNKPYFAKSVSEFWTRWHISLSTWFRDYLYIPLGGNRVRLPRQCFNLLFTFLISGLWHGASWTYVLWGALHGFYLIGSRLLTPWKNNFAAAIGLKKLPTVARVASLLITFNLVCIAWVLFRANTLGDAFLIFGRIFGSWENGLAALFQGLSYSETILSVSLILGLLLFQVLDSRKSLVNLPVLAKQAGYVVFFFLFIVLVITNNPGSKRFIYFQF